MTLSPQIVHRAADDESEIQKRQKKPQLPGTARPGERRVSFSQEPVQTPAFTQSTEDRGTGEKQKAGNAEQQPDAVPHAGDQQGIAPPVEHAKHKKIEGQ